MSFARTTADIEIGSALPFSSLRDSIKQTTIRRDEPKLTVSREEYQRLSEAAKKQTQERRAKYELGLELIDRGYKSLAKELHSDKGGTDEAMARLNDVRNHLRKFV
jgi:hypothetical protein